MARKDGELASEALLALFSGGDADDPLRLIGAALVAEHLALFRGLMKALSKE